MKLKTPSRAAATLTVGLFLLAATTMFAQQFAQAREKDEVTAKLVCDMVQRYHISRRGVDSETSKLLMDRYLEQLDPQKLYFSQSDIDEFRKYRDELDALLKAGDTRFAYTVFDRFLQRLEERITLAHRLIDADHDFTVDESMVTDPEKLSWAKSDGELEERWRKRIKYDILPHKLDGTELDEIRDRLHKRYQNVLTTAKQTSDSEKLEMYLSALTHCFDPHSTYMSPDTVEDFRISMQLRLEGIGAALRNEDGYTTVASIVPGGAAAADGRLQVNDKIIGVGQEEGEIVDVVEMKLSRVVRLIRGEKGTTVRLQVKTADTGEVQVYELVRQTIELKSSEVKGRVIESNKRLDGPSLRVGVIDIPSFYRDFDGARNATQNFKSTSRDVRAILEDFKDQGVDVVVVDLRMNGGGALAEAIEVTGLFIGDGPVVQVKEQDGKVKVHYSDEAEVAWGGPLVVVCNRLSASASEIFAGAIKDYGRGIVVGDTTTHGKGTVQNVMPVMSRQLFRFLDQPGGEDRGHLKLTINQFYRVSGDSTQSKGVESDVVLPSVYDHMDLGESFLDNALGFDRIDSVRHNSYDMVTPEMISALRQGSQRRVAADQKFQEVQEDIQRLLARKKRSEVSLNEEVRRKERKEEKKREKEEEALLEELDGEGPVFPDDHYNNEILAISVDYVGLLKDARTAQK